MVMHFAILAQALPPMLVDSNDLDWAGNSPGDPLDPSFVGETMSMPLDPELIQKAKDAGIIRDSGSPYNYRSGSGSINLGTPLPGMKYGDAGTMDLTAQAGPSMNVTGDWSLDLISLDQALRHMDLDLVQNRDVVMGYGVLTGDSDAQRVTASGSESGGRLILTVMPVDKLHLYTLDLSLDLLTKGTYEAYSADGSIWSGDIAGTAPSSMLASLQ